MSIEFERLGDRAPISLYPAGMFQFAGRRHQGALLISPDGIYGWPAPGFDMGENGWSSLPKLAEGLHCDLLLLGTGPKPLLMRAEFRAAVERLGLGLEAMDTAAAIRTYNILLAENRRFLAALLPA